MSLTYCIPTYNSFDRCVQAIHAVMKSSVLPDQIIIIDDSGTGASLEKIVPVLTEYYANGYRNFFVWVHERRCGVAASWNQFLRDTQTDLVLIANDDVMPHADSIGRMILSAQEHPEEIFFAGDGHSGNSFSFFMVRRAEYLEKIGWFDECFYPAYFEDNSASRKITLAGFKHIFVDGAIYDHVGSSTLKTYTPAETQQHHRDFERNRNMYIAMWGGLPGSEIYHLPFNGEKAPWE